MNGEFAWWLLIVGLVIGGGLVYLVVAEAARREADVTADELPLEATWISHVLESEGVPVDPPIVERVLLLHREYLMAPPPDEAIDPEEVTSVESHASERTGEHVITAAPPPPPPPASSPRTNASSD